MAYICTKKLNAGGKEYLPGSVIEDGVLLPSRVNKLKAFGYIAELDGEAPVYQAQGQLLEAEGGCISFTVPGETEGEDVAYPVSAEQLKAIMETMRKKADDAAKAVEEEVDESVLAFIAYCDSRNKVKEAASKQLNTVMSLKSADDPQQPSPDAGAQQE